MIRSKKEKERKKLKIQKLVEDYNDRTKNVRNETVMSILLPDDFKEPWHFFQLLEIAEHYQPLGIFKAILFAFKMGYMSGLNSSENLGGFEK